MNILGGRKPQILGATAFGDIHGNAGFSANLSANNDRS
jgi:hypothetical protein